MSIPELSMTRAGKYTRTQLATELRANLLKPCSEIPDVVLFRFLRSTVMHGSRAAMQTGECDFVARDTQSRFW